MKHREITRRTEWRIIDGYSLMHEYSGPPAKNCELSVLRAHLVCQIQKAFPQAGEDLTIVFDGRGAAIEPAPEADGLEILFSPEHQTADAVIERMVAEDTHPARITVVTSDQAENDLVSALGARVQSCPAFLEELDFRQRRTKTAVCNLQLQAPKVRLGDFFPL